MPDFIEKRRYPRIFFPTGQRVEAEIVHEASGQAMQVILLDISEGGMGLRLKRPADFTIAREDRILLKTIHGQPYLSSLKEIYMQVCWVLDDDFLDHIALGCQFLDLNPKDKAMLQDFTLLKHASGKEEMQETL